MIWKALFWSTHLGGRQRGTLNLLPLSPTYISAFFYFSTPSPRLPPLLPYYPSDNPGTPQSNRFFPHMSAGLTPSLLSRLFTSAISNRLSLIPLCQVAIPRSYSLSPFSESLFSIAFITICYGIYFTVHHLLPL